MIESPTLTKEDAIALRRHALIACKDTHESELYYLYTELLDGTFEPWHDDQLYTAAEIRELVAEYDSVAAELAD